MAQQRLFIDFGLLRSPYCKISYLLAEEHWFSTICGEWIFFKSDLYGLLGGGVAVQLEHDAGFVREANERDSRLGLRDSETANERDDEVFHEVPVGEVDGWVGLVVDDATGRVQYERHVSTRVAASCNINNTLN